MTFYKYHGTGNDFILIDNRKNNFPKDNIDMIEKLCHRRFGIGADGLILLENHEVLDFKMVYYNADGNPSTMCGNGGRCIVSFAKKIGLIENKTKFEAVDGVHEATIDADNMVSLKMSNVASLEKITNNSFFLDTGSPHCVHMVEKMPKDDFLEKAKAIRFSEQYKDEGVNVNFVKVKEKDTADIRTYERGVEDETYSCGTGAVAAAIVVGCISELEKIKLHTKGGELTVFFKERNKRFEEVYLVGSTNLIYIGQI